MSPRFQTTEADNPTQTFLLTFGLFSGSRSPALSSFPLPDLKACSRFHKGVQQLKTTLRAPSGSTKSEVVGEVSRPAWHFGQGLWPKVLSSLVRRQRGISEEPTGCYGHRVMSSRCILRRQLAYLSSWVNLQSESTFPNSQRQRVPTSAVPRWLSAQPACRGMARPQPRVVR